jgi:hypothetical protein
MKMIRCLLVPVGLLLGGVFESRAADVPALANQAPTVAAKVPYHGVVCAVNPDAKTFSLKGKDRERVFKVGGGTRILRDGAASDLSTLVLGEEVRGQALRGQGLWDAVSVLVGARAEAPVKAPKATVQKAMKGE